MFLTKAVGSWVQAHCGNVTEHTSAPEDAPEDAPAAAVVNSRSAAICAVLTPEVRETTELYITKILGNTYSEDFVRRLLSQKVLALTKYTSYLDSVSSSQYIEPSIVALAARLVYEVELLQKVLLSITKRPYSDKTTAALARLGVISDE